MTKISKEKEREIQIEMYRRSQGITEHDIQWAKKEEKWWIAKTIWNKDSYMGRVWVNFCFCFDDITIKDFEGTNKY